MFDEKCLEEKTQILLRTPARHEEINNPLSRDIRYIAHDVA